MSNLKLIWLLILIAMVVGYICCSIRCDSTDFALWEMEISGGLIKTYIVLIIIGGVTSFMKKLK